MKDLVRFVLIYSTFLLYIFYNIYYVYLEILRFKIYFENCAKSKREEQEKSKGVVKKMLVF